MPKVSRRRWPTEVKEQSTRSSTHWVASNRHRSLCYDRLAMTLKHNAGTVLID
jgi:hypothetical protein